MEYFVSKVCKAMFPFKSICLHIWSTHVCSHFYRAKCVFVHLEGKCMTAHFGGQMYAWKVWGAEVSHALGMQYMSVVLFGTFSFKIHWVSMALHVLFNQCSVYCNKNLLQAKAISFRGQLCLPIIKGKCAFTHLEDQICSYKWWGVNVSCHISSGKCVFTYLGG